MRATLKKGDAVRVRFERSTAIELALYADEDEFRDLGLRLLKLLERGCDSPAYEGTIVIPPPNDRADDPQAPVSVAIPDLDDSGDLFVVSQRELERCESDANGGPASEETPFSSR